MNPLRRFRVVSWLLLAAVPLAAQTKEQLNPTHVGRVTDWSYGHVVVSGGASAANLEAARTEPRILFHLVERNLLQVFMTARYPPLPCSTRRIMSRRFHRTTP